MALEQTGWETTLKWASSWSVGIQRMIEDLVGWLAKPEVTNLVTPEMPMLNKIAREALW